MTRRIMQCIGILVVLSMFLTACAGGTQATQPPATAEPEQNEAAAETPESLPAVEEEQPTAELIPTDAPVEQEKSSRLGGWLDKVIFTSIADPEPAVAQIQAGAVDVYSATIDKADVFAKVQADPELGYANTYGSSNQLLFNTVTCNDENILNPFSDQKIREAMNWAIDRDYVVQEIFGGLGLPKYTPFYTAFPDYARYADLFSVIETQYAYNLEKAAQVVDEEMVKLGATKGSDGIWQYKGKPVTLIGLIRTEDKRKEIGEYFSNQLEKLGFAVDRQEKVRKEASPIWQGDPTLCKFHFYTAGWIANQIYRDEGLNFAEYNTGKLQNLPIFNAFQPSKELLEAGDALLTNDFKNMEERRKLFEVALNDSMTESWWGVWVNDSISFHAFNKDAQGACDLAAGFGGGQVYPFTTRWANQEGGTLRIANSAILVEAWNPIAGSNWIDDTVVRNFTTDYGVIYNPYTGLYMPKLVETAELVAEEGLPIAAPQSDWITLKTEKEVVVPDDAWADWDASKQAFITAAEKAKSDPEWQKTSKIKVTVVYSPDLWKSTWHDGSSLSVADFVYAMIMNFDPGKPESKIYDESTAAAVETYLTHFKGVRITSTNPLTIETYEDQYYLDPENNVVDWYPNIYRVSQLGAGMLAWHNLTPAVQAEADGKMAFSQTKSTDKQIDRTSQASGPTLDVQMQYVDQDITDKYIPYAATMSQFLTEEEALTRYNNLKAFYAAHKHIVLGTGPYMVDQVYPVEQSISLIHYDPYIFPADQFSELGEPKMMTVSVDGPTTIAAGTETSFDVTIDFDEQPYPADEIDTVAFILFNSDGAVAEKGTAELISDGMYQVVLGQEVTSKLSTGTAKLTIAASSKVVSLPAFESAEFVVTQ